MPTNVEMARTVAQDLVQRFDPDVIEEFDNLWEDLTTGPEADRVLGEKHGTGLEILLHESWSLIIIPLIGALVKKAVDLSVDAIVSWIKQRRGGKSDPQDQEVAQAVVDTFQAYKAEGGNDQQGFAKPVS